MQKNMKKRYISPKSRVITIMPDEISVGITESYTSKDGSWDNITGDDINYTDDDSHIFIRGTEKNTAIQDIWK